MKHRYQVIVAGGGASGMTAAILAAGSGLRTAVLEAGETVGKKLLATGNGKCNFTNSLQTPDCYRGSGAEAAGWLLKRCGTDRVLSFFEQIGIYPKERNGYWYPNSGQAASVREALYEELLRSGADVITCCRVKSVEPAESISRKQRTGNGKTGLERASSGAPCRPRFRITAGKRELLSSEPSRPKRKKKEKPRYSEEREIFFEADHVILACGGSAGSFSGAEGSGFAVAEELGLGMAEPVPALVQLRAAERECGVLSGVRLEAAGKLILPGGAVFRERGEFLFTDYGISGIPAMQLSRFASVYLNRAAKPQDGCPKLFLDFFPDTEENKLAFLLEERFRRFGWRSAEGVLLGLLPSKLNYVLLCLAGLAPEKRPEPDSGFPEKAGRMLAGRMKRFLLTITGTNSFDSAQVTAGGVLMEELSADTLEAKRIPGLYVTGELADVDGTCGGYNLHWAWMSGMAAAESIIRNEGN